jgi:diaminopimelate decarboxylase/protein-L-isoaspartate O-methyltransferase
MEKIDYEKSKKFWDKRAEIIGKDDFLLATTLQDDILPISGYRDVTEKKHLFRVVGFSKKSRVLDLGGGTGRWSIELAKKVKDVTLVDFSSRLLAIARKQAEKEGLTNIDFIQSSVTEFKIDKLFDFILISGVLMYVNDQDLSGVADRCFSFLYPEGKLIIREGVSLAGNIKSINQYSKELQDNYSVIWRDPDEYVNIFGKRFCLEYNKDAFPFLIPVFFYKRIIPRKYKKKDLVQKILKKLLFWQSKIDFLLLKFKAVMDLYHLWLRRKTPGVAAYFYIFKKIARQKSNFKFEGIDLVEFLKNKKTPFYLISEDRIKKNYKMFMEGFFALEKKPAVYYSVKTNYESGVLKSMKKIGIGVEIGGSLDLCFAKKAGFRYSQMVVDGLFKDKELLEEAVSNDAKVINVESIGELLKIDELAKKYNKVVRAGLRLSLDRRWGDWRNLLVDRNKKCFGMTIKQIKNNLDAILKCKNVNVNSLLVHTSKSFVSPADYGFLLKKMFGVAEYLKSRSIIVDEFNLGGGFPINFGSKYNLYSFSSYISKVYLKYSKLNSFKPELSFEIGKGLVGDAAILVGRVQAVRGKSVIVDISHNDYGYVFPLKKRRLVVANKNNWPKTVKYYLWSDTLEKFDVILKGKMKLPRISKADILVLFDVGAYSIPLSNQFLKPRCAVYFITGQGSEINIRKAEKAEDMVFQRNWDF